MRRLQFYIALFAALALGCALATSAVAADVSAIYRDCETNGKLTGHYSQALLKSALKKLPSEVAEYSACSNIIQQALAGASSHGGGPTGGPTGGSGPKGGGSGPKGVSSGPKGVSSGPGSGGSGPNGTTSGITGFRPDASSGGSLPTPLILVLILLALTALSGAAVAIRRRVVARHST